MASQLENARHIQKQSTFSGTTFTIPPSNDHTDGTWTTTDLYVSEFGLNSNDDKLYIRTLNGIKQIPFSDQIPTGSTSNNFIKIDGSSSATTGHIKIGVNQTIGLEDFSAFIGFESGSPRFKGINEVKLISEIGSYQFYNSNIKIATHNFEALTDSRNIAWQDKSYIGVADLSDLTNFIPEAPIDDGFYVRRNGTWIDITSYLTGGTITNLYTDSYGNNYVDGSGNNYTQ